MEFNRLRGAAGGMPDGRWPPYASQIVVELWQAAEGAEAGGHHHRSDRSAFVRVIYNGKPVVVEGCFDAAGGVSPEWCPLHRWEVRLNTVAVKLTI
eukprot:1186728-Pyramimonas_sp.AAC.2